MSPKPESGAPSMRCAAAPVLAGVFTLLLLGATLVLVYAQERRTEAVASRQIVHLTADFLADRLTRSIAAISQAADTVRPRDLQPNKRLLLTGRLIQIASRLREVQSASVLNPVGDVVSSTIITGSPANSEFDEQSDGYRYGLLSPPGRLTLHIAKEQSTNGPHVLAVRRIDDGHGKLVGVIVFVLRTSVLQRMIMPRWMPEGLDARIVSNDLLLGPSRGARRKGSYSGDKASLLHTSASARSSSLAKSLEVSVTSDISLRIDWAHRSATLNDIMLSDHLGLFSLVFLATVASAFLFGLSSRGRTGLAKDTIVAMMDVEHSSTLRIQRLELALAEAVRTRNLTLASVGHDVRTLLTSVVGFATLLHGSELMHEQRSWTDMLLVSSQSLTDMLNGLLEIAGDPSADRQLFLADINIGELVTETCGVLERQARDKGLEFDVRVSRDLTAIWRSDMVRLRQIILNLLGNAIKYTSAGRVFVSASVSFSRAEREAEVQEGTIKFVVSDTGPGIPASDQTRIFEEFKRGSLHEAERGGLGLGLAICRANAALLGGAIELESEVGSGSEFRLLFPCQRVRRIAGPVHSSSFIAIVVGLDEAVRRQVSLRLGESGYSVSVAPDGFIGLALVERTGLTEGRVDVIVVDESMAGLAASAFVERLQALPVYEHTRVVWVAASDGCDASEVASFADALVPQQGNVRDIVAAVCDLMSATSEAKPHSDVVSAGRDMRVLVVEDDLAIQKVLTTYLMGHGFSVFTAKNGEDAVARAAQGIFDAILMDLQLPGLDGFEATRRIRAFDGSAGSVPIIAQTALTGSNVYRRCTELGIHQVVAKPHDMYRLAVTLREAVRTARVSNPQDTISGSEGRYYQTLGPDLVTMSAEIVAHARSNSDATGSMDLIARLVSAMHQQSRQISELVPNLEWSMIECALSDLLETVETAGAGRLCSFLRHAIIEARSRDRHGVEEILNGVTHVIARICDLLMRHLGDSSTRLDLA